MTALNRTDSQVMQYCRKINMKKARTPSNRAMSLLKMTVARVEPRATVTTKSKAFILDKVRLPEMRSIIIREAYARIVMITMWTTLSQESKKIFFINGGVKVLVERNGLIPLKVKTIKPIEIL